MKARHLTTLTIFLLPAPPALHAGDLAARVPADALLYLDWSNVPNDGQSLIGMVDAVLNAPVVQRKMGHDGEHARELLSMLRPILAKPGAVVVLPAPPGRPFPEGFGILIEAGADAAPMSARFTQIVTRLHGGNAPVPAQVGSHSLMRADVPGGAFYFGAVKEYVVMGACEATAKRVADMVTGGEGALADAPAFKLARSKIEPSDKGFGLTFFAQMHAFLQALNAIEPLAPDEAALQDRVFKALGVQAMRTIYLRVDTTEYGPRMAAFTQVEGEGGLAVSVYRQKPLTDDDVRLVPKDASFALICNLDLSALWKDALNAADQVSPEPRAAIEAGVMQASQMLQFHPVNDLLANVGDTWAIYDSPSHGGLLLTGVVLCGETKDAAALHRMLSRIVQFVMPLAASHEVTLQLRQMKHGGHDINYLLVGGLPIPAAPAWGFAGDRWVLGLNPQTVATALTQVDAQTRGESLLEHPDFKAARSRLPKEITTVIYSDTRATYRVWYALRELAYTMVASLTAGSSAPFDLGAAPPYPEDLKGVRNFVAAYSHDSDGVLYAAYGAHPAAVILSTNGGAASTAMMVSILLPSLARAREQSKRVVSLSNLRGIGVACMIYAHEHEEQLPPTLDALVEMGSITETMLTSPRDPTGGRSYVYIEGQSMNADARNVLAYEKVIGHEGTSVLFCDTHVEWLKPEVFRKVVADTYKRLNRPVPPEFED
ncbi:MAG: hypothetical protein FLDDKLPJ_02989 [Phycisphaerae bacterium]|nr:hypothetical protein [Phycisphaerae bacterium]